MNHITKKKFFLLTGLSLLVVDAEGNSGTDGNPTTEIVH